MKHNNTIPFSSIDIVLTESYHSILLDALHPNIQEKVLSLKPESRYVMIKSDIGYVSICLHMENSKALVLIFTK